MDGEGDARGAYKLQRTGPTLVVLWLSTALMLYLGWSAASRDVPRLELDRLLAQGQVIRMRLDSFLLAGLPLEQFPGFASLTAPILRADPDLAAIEVRESGDRVLFRAGVAPPDPSAAPVSNTPPAVDGLPPGVRMETVGALDRVTQELQGRFGPAGTLRLEQARAVADGHVRAAFLPAVLLVLLLLLPASVLAWRLEGRRARWITPLLGLMGVITTIVVLGTLLRLTADEEQRKVTGAAAALAARLQAPFDLGLRLDDFTGINTLLDEARTRDPDLASVVLSSGTQVLAASPLVAAPASGALVELTRPVGPGSGEILTLRVSVPVDVIAGKLWSSARGCAALLLSSLLASSFLVQLRGALVGGRIRDVAATHPAMLLRLAGPLYFLGVFADSLNNAFLPQQFRDIATQDGVPPEGASALFTVYFLAYAVALGAAGLSGERRLRPLLLAGPALTAAHLLILATTRSFPLLVLSQAADGLGQGLLFAALGAYIVRVAPAGHRARGAAGLVFGYYGGVFAAVAIGGQLAADPAIGRTGVFWAGAVLALGAFIYAAAWVPEPATTVPDPGAAAGAAAPGGRPAARLPVWTAWRASLHDAEFLRAALLVGLPTKIIMAGLVSATLPLLLARAGYGTADIAQLLMCYPAGVLLIGPLAASWADRRRPLGLLLVGTLGAAGGLLLAGLPGWQPWGALGTTGTVLAIGGGLLLLGLAHGCIQAPVVGHVAGTHLAERLGPAGAVGCYRLWERVGNVAGPLLVAQAVSWAPSGLGVLCWLGAGTLLCAGALAAGTLRQRSTGLQQIGSAQ